ncbi:hypothetical protein C8R46DRAFT_1053559, partial [Mycena filopes]
SNPSLRLPLRRLPKSKDPTPARTRSPTLTLRRRPNPTPRMLPKDPTPARTRSPFLLPTLRRSPDPRPSLLPPRPARARPPSLRRRSISTPRSMPTPGSPISTPRKQPLTPKARSLQCHRLEARTTSGRRWPPPNRNSTLRRTTSGRRWSIPTAPSSPTRTRRTSTLKARGARRGASCIIMQCCRSQVKGLTKRQGA